MVCVFGLGKTRRRRRWTKVLENDSYQANRFSPEAEPRKAGAGPFVGDWARYKGKRTAGDLWRRRC